VTTDPNPTPSAPRPGPPPAAHQPPPGGQRPAPPPGGQRPAPPPGGQRPAPPPGGQRPGWQGAGDGRAPADGGDRFARAAEVPAEMDQEPGADDRRPRADGGTGHPAVDAVLRALANAAALAPAEQIAEYEAAHRVLRETLASIAG
jgi:hypothetical protein